jgi:hypothetical protein
MTLKWFQWERHKERSVHGISLCLLCALCPAPCALCPVLCALCPVLCALRPVPCALCPVPCFLISELLIKF